MLCLPWYQFILRGHRPGRRTLPPLAALAPEPVRRGGAGAGRDVERRVVHVAAVVERAVPRTRPVVGQAVGAEDERRVVVLVGHVVVAAAQVQGLRVRHDPHRVARRAHAVPVAARQREVVALRRVLLVQVRLELAVADEDLPVVRDVPVDPFGEVPVVGLLVDPVLQVVLVARQVGLRHLLQDLQRHRVDPVRWDDVARRRASARPCRDESAPTCTGRRWSAPCRSASTG